MYFFFVLLTHINYDSSVNMQVICGWNYIIVYRFFFSRPSGFNLKRETVIRSKIIIIFLCTILFFFPRITTPAYFPLHWGNFTPSPHPIILDRKNSMKEKTKIVLASPLFHTEAPMAALFPLPPK